MNTGSIQTQDFPLTATQEAYLVGRGSQVAFGEVGCHGYWEWRREFRHGDELRVRQAWAEVVNRHPALRTVICDRSTQRILPGPVSWDFAVNDWRSLSSEEADRHLGKLRATLSHHIFDPGTFPLWDMQVTLMPDEYMTIHFSLDLLIADAWSYYQILVPELAALFQDRELNPAPTSTFRDWIFAARESITSDSWHRAKQYWTERLSTFPSAPRLPAGTNEGNTFTRLEDSLPADEWTELQRIAGARRVTGTALMAAVLGDVFQLWGAGEKFVITVPTFTASRASQDYAGVVGDFTSTILLEIDGTGDTFGIRARAVQRQLWSDLPHVAFSGIHVAREIARATGSTDASYPVVLTSLLGQPPREFHTALGDATYTSTQTPQVSLDVQVAEVDGALTWSWDHRTSAFSEGVMADAFAEFGRALRSLLKDCAWSADGLLARLPAHQSRARYEANDTDGPTPDRPLPLLMLEHARQHPEAPAVVGQDGGCMSYAQLRERITAAAAVIMGHAQDSGPVAIVMRKQVDQLVYAHAANHTGRAFVPLDAEQPFARLGRALETAKPSLIVATDDLTDQITGLSAAPVVTPAAVAGQTPMLDRCGDSGCYVVYTSGTSGQPKGVAVSHPGVANAFEHMIEIAEVDAADVAYAVSPFHFDLGMFETLGILAVGGSVVVAPDTVDPRRWLRDVQLHGVTVWNSTPALLGLLLDAAEEHSEVLPRLRTVILAGDRIPGQLPRRLRRLAPHAKLIASGGPAETCVWSIYHRVPADFPGNSDSVPYGRPMRNQRYLVIDDWGREVPDWVEGEMVVESQIGLADGYLNMPELTAEKFTTCVATGRRRYRTGDLGRWRPDGQIEILGRKDFQVKINGIRIELGEVATALKTIPKVTDAVVVQAGGSSAAPLVAFVVSNDLGMSEESARAHVEGVLPRAAVPARVIVAPRLPLTTNGKVDLLSLQRTAVEALSAEISRIDDSSEPGPVEVVLLACWRSCLGRQIGLDQNFFSAGATSLDVAKTTMRIGSITEVDVDSRALFIHPTARSAAAALVAKHGQEIVNRCKLITNA